MSSGFDLRLGLALAAAVGVAGCEERRASPEAAPPPQVVDSPIGPQPGPHGADTSAGTNPVAGDENALTEGRRFFVSYNCAGCHGDHAGGGMGPSLRDSSWIYGSSDADIADSIVEGRAHGMPSWARLLTPEQVWQITAYIKSLRSDREPDPPR